jgi:cytochrome c oxidase subunit II
VIHDFYVPAFRTKTDVLPGRYTTEWFRPTKVGAYHIFCAEYCGTKHSGMIGTVYVMNEADYDAWLGAGSGEGSMAEQGQALFNQLGCGTCHASEINKQTGRCPNLNGLFGTTVELKDGSKVRADEAYIRESVLYPQAKIVAGFDDIMPTFKGLITEDGLLKVVEYIKSLGPKNGMPSSATPAPTQTTGEPTGPNGKATARATPAPAGNR